MTTLGTPLDDAQHLRRQKDAQASFFIPGRFVRVRLTALPRRRHDGVDQFDSAFNVLVTLESGHLHVSVVEHLDLDTETRMESGRPLANVIA